jgi:hypothetical protein
MFARKTSEAEEHFQLQLHKQRQIIYITAAHRRTRQWSRIGASTDSSIRPSKNEYVRSVWLPWKESTNVFCKRINIIGSEGDELQSCNSCSTSRQRFPAPEVIATLGLSASGSQTICVSAPQSLKYSQFTGIGNLKELGPHAKHCQDSSASTTLWNMA